MDAHVSSGPSIMTSASLSSSSSIAPLTSTPLLPTTSAAAPIRAPPSLDNDDSEEEEEEGYETEEEDPVEMNGDMGSDSGSFLSGEEDFLETVSLSGKMEDLHGGSPTEKQGNVPIAKVSDDMEEDGVLSDEEESGRKATEFFFNENEVGVLEEEENGVFVGSGGVEVVEVEDELGEVEIHEQEVEIGGGSMKEEDGEEVSAIKNPNLISPGGSELEGNSVFGVGNADASVTPETDELEGNSVFGVGNADASVTPETDEVEENVAGDADDTKLHALDNEAQTHGVDDKNPNSISSELKEGLVIGVANAEEGSAIPETGEMEENVAAGDSDTMFRSFDSEVQTQGFDEKKVGGGDSLEENTKIELGTNPILSSVESHEIPNLGRDEVPAADDDDEQKAVRPTEFEDEPESGEETIAEDIGWVVEEKEKSPESQIVHEAEPDPDDEIVDTDEFSASKNISNETIGDIVEGSDDNSEVFEKLMESQYEDGGSPSARHLDFVQELEKFINSSVRGETDKAVVVGDDEEEEEEEEGDEGADTDEEDGDDDGKVLFDSAALTALLKAASDSSAESGNGSSSGPAGLGSTIPALRPSVARTIRSSIFAPADFPANREPETEMSEEERKMQEKVNSIRVKFLRIVYRLGHSHEETVAAQVLYRLSLAEGFRRSRGAGVRMFSHDAACKTARELEEQQRDDLDFSCTILVLGKTGVGKSATINSIFDEEKTPTSAFLPGTDTVREITGNVDGVKIRLIDTPGLKPSILEQSANKKVLLSVKKFTKKCPPDIVVYVDRLDARSRDSNDLPLLRSITAILGVQIWSNAMVALTHASCAPPDGPNGTPLAYDTSVAHRSHSVQHSIRQAAGDMRLMSPVALVENHPSCRRNREGERVLPNGSIWRSQLLLLCYSTRILAEANSLMKLQDPMPGKLFFGQRFRPAPLPYLLSSLLQSRVHPKLATADQFDEDFDIVDDLSDAENDEDEDEYDQLPPFTPLTKAEVGKLSKEEKTAYYDEYEYRFRLLQKKQLKDQIKMQREAKKRAGAAAGGVGEEYYEGDGGPAAVPVPLPDMALPPSFDSDNPAYRYRFLEPSGTLLARAVLDSHGWDHDCGYDGVSLEENTAIAGRFPAGFAVQVTKDKKDFNVHFDSSLSVKHGDHGSTLTGFDVQTVGKQLAYIFRTESKFKNMKKNKTAAGVTVTRLGETVATGVKMEDQVVIGKRVNLSASAGAIRAQGDVAYGANLEARLMDKDYPIGQDNTTLGLSLMKWRGDLALGANLQSQISVGRGTKTAIRIGLNNKFSGQITIRTSSSEHGQIALVAILPVVVAIFRAVYPGEEQFVN